MLASILGMAKAQVDYETAQKASLQSFGENRHDITTTVFCLELTLPRKCIDADSGTCAVWNVLCM